MRNAHRLSNNISTIHCWTWPTGFLKTTLVARGTDTQLDPSCVSAPLAINLGWLHVLRNACLNHRRLAFELA